MLDHLALDSVSQRDETELKGKDSKPKASFGRALSAPLFVAVVLSGAVYTGFLAFSCLVNYDDEGVVLLFVQHMLDGHAIYDRVDCLYGPFYLFARWLAFGVLHVPLGNDALRVETLVTWWATALLLAMTTWRLVRDLPCRAGITALVWILSVCQLFVLPREPGHPQEVVALLLAASLFVAATMKDRRRSISLVLLGGLAAGIVLTKINVGVFYLLALAITLLALTPRSSAFWLALRCAAACAILILPWRLMKSRFGDGYGAFCFVMTCAILPCLGRACFKVRLGTVGIREMFWCALGTALVAFPMVGFAVWQGNTLGGMVNALVFRTWSNFASAPIGTPMPIILPGLVWAVGVAAIGLATLGASRSCSRLLSPLRLIACVMVFLIAASRNHEVFLPFSFALPLVWLVMVPPIGREPTEADWFFRAFLAFTTVLQPLQIFPVTGSQVLIGTLALLVVAVVLALDAYREIRDLAAAQPRFFAERAPALKRLLLIAIAIASMRPRAYEILGSLWTLPSATSVYALFAAALGLIVLRFEPSIRKFLWPLKLIVCGWILVGLVTSPPWDMTWLRLALPLCWLIWIDSPGPTTGVAATYVRLSLVASACLELLNLLPVVHLVGRPFHFAVFLMLVIGVVLFLDAGRDLGLIGRVRAGGWALGATANLVLLLVALLLGLVAMVDAEEGYRMLTALDLPGCRWTRMPEREAALCTFLASNVQKSSDCAFARFGLESLHFWAEQRPASDVVPISNLWAQMDRISDERLLEAHRNRLRMLFIDNPNPWNPVPPKMKFLDFISTHFKLLARVGPTRLLVRKERKDLDLYDCAFQRRAAPGGPPDRKLMVRLPADHETKAVATIELVDLNEEPPNQFLTSTAADPARRLMLNDGAGCRLLPSETGSLDLSDVDSSRYVSLPEGINLATAGFPALRFLAPDGRRLLTLPVVIDADDGVR